MLHFHAQHMFCNVAERAPCDRRQNRSGFGCDNGAVFGYKQEVCAAGFLNIGSGCRVKVQIFVIALFMRLHNGVQAHGVVQTGFDMACAVRSGSVIIRNADGDRLCAALEIGANRCAEHSELIFICGLYADNGVRAEHIRADVKRCAGTVRRYPRIVCLNNLINCVNKFLFREHRHLKSFRGSFHTSGVKIRAETYRSAVCRCICLKALKYGLGILKYARAFIHCDIRIGSQGAVIPFAVLKI